MLAWTTLIALCACCMWPMHAEMGTVRAAAVDRTLDENVPTELILVFRGLLVSTCQQQRMNFALVFLMSTNIFFSSLIGHNFPPFVSLTYRLPYECRCFEG